MSLYGAFYGFRVAPFSLNPDPKFLFPSNRHVEALAGLLHVVSDGKGFAVLTGEVGSGKTTVVHALLDQLRNSTSTALLFNPNLSQHDLYLHLLAEFRLPAQPTVLACVRTLQSFLLEQFEAGKRVAVIIDEAHALSDELLEEVRLLSNFETSRSKLLQVLLVGQPELIERLQTPKLRQLRQRLAHRFQLAPLSFTESIDYIRTRLRAAEAKRDIFTPAAFASLHAYSGGLPRLLNVLCDNALLTGFARQRETVGSSLIRRAAGDLGLRAVARVGPWQRLRARYRKRPDRGQLLQALGQYASAPQSS